MSRPDPCDGIPIVDWDKNPKCVHLKEDHKRHAVHHTTQRGQLIKMCPKCFEWYKREEYKERCQDLENKREAHKELRRALENKQTEERLERKIKAYENISLTLKVIVAQLDKLDILRTDFSKPDRIDLSTDEEEKKT